MTDGSPAGSPEDPTMEKILLDQFGWAIRQLHGVIVEIEAGGEAAQTEADRKKVVSRLRDFLSQLTKERAYVQEMQGGANKGVRGGEVFDFGAVRAEIGRRLDRLRAAADAGGVP